MNPNPDDQNSTTNPGENTPPTFEPTVSPAPEVVPFASVPTETPVSDSTQPTDAADSTPVVEQQPAEQSFNAPTQETPLAEAPVASAPLNPFATPQPTQSTSVDSTPVPTAVAAPVMASASAAPVAPGTPGGKNKKMLLIGIIAGGVLLLVAVAVVLYLTVFAVKKEDYQAAVVQVEAVSLVVEGDSLAGGLQGSSSFEEFKADHDKFKAANKELDTLKAVKFDGEVKQKYDAYKTKADAYTVYIDQLIPSYDTLSELLDSMQSGLSDSTSYSTFFKEIAADFKEAATQASDPDIKEFLSNGAVAFEEAAGYMEIATNPSSTSSEQLEAAYKAQDVMEEFGTNSKAISDKINDRYDELNPEAEFNALLEVLTKKAA